MGFSHLGLVQLVHSVLLLSGVAEETPTTRHVILEENKNDPKTMRALQQVLVTINRMNAENASGRKLTFSLGVLSSKFTPEPV
jgi:hypothetical protein